MIATDHILTVWARVKHQHNDTYFEEIGSVMRNTSVEILQKPSLKYLYSIKFLTAAPTTIFTCEQDPYTLFFLLKDSIVRSCSPLDVGSHYLNEYWKFTKKYKIVKAVCHPE